jgi:hydroxymethylglutaryl-CoA reductase
MRFSGFSKLSAAGKLNKLVEEGILDAEALNSLTTFQPKDPLAQSLFEKMAENVIGTFPTPYSIAPGFLINNKPYVVPMVTEESSVVAAASWSARFWTERGGFRTKVISETKIGQIHFLWSGDPGLLSQNSPAIFSRLRSSVVHLTKSMEYRGGGITGFELINLTDTLERYFQIRVSFLTADSMGANFINSCLEMMAAELCRATEELIPVADSPEIIMSILSNHTPDCRVECMVECPIPELAGIRGVEDPADFARRFSLAVQIATIDPYRAVTHNKGIYNGIDAVILATANDFRAVEAAGHAYASIGGQYRSLTSISIDNNIFRYTLEVPMAVGTVGGLTKAHPMAALSLKILGNPTAGELMQIAASVGLANNFAALKALTTTGIQAGHMPLHQRKQKQ